jgi:hypothetical protein
MLLHSCLMMVIAKSIAAVQRAGDLVYVPDGWAHGARPSLRHLHPGYPARSSSQLLTVGNAGVLNLEPSAGWAHSFSGPRFMFTDHPHKYTLSGKLHSLL